MAISDVELAQSKNIAVEQVPLLRQSRGMTNESLEALSEDDVQQAIARLDHPDLPGGRHAFRLQQEGGDGIVPTNALGNALDEVLALQRVQRWPNRAGMPTGLRAEAPGPPEPTAGLNLTRWQWLGPGNIGGRTRGLVIHPERSERMWAASAGGGVWHTSDGGAHWTPVDDRMANLSCACIAMDPSRVQRQDPDGDRRLCGIRTCPDSGVGHIGVGPPGA